MTCEGSKFLDLAAKARWIGGDIERGDVRRSAPAGHDAVPGVGIAVPQRRHQATP